MKQFIQVFIFLSLFVKIYSSDLPVITSWSKYNILKVTEHMLQDNNLAELLVLDQGEEKSLSKVEELIIDMSYMYLNDANLAEVNFKGLDIKQIQLEGNLLKKLPACIYH